jgi:hypothetical protein
MKRRARVIVAKRDFTAFVELVGRDETGQSLVLAELHRAWHRHVNYCWERKLHAGILAHWGSGKSSGLVVPLVAFVLGHDNNTRVKIVTNDDASARRRVASIKRILESPQYLTVFADVQRGAKWAESEVYLKRKGYANDPSIQARGVFSTGIGTRADCIVFDDVCDQKNSAEPAQRRRVRELVEATWLSRLESGGKALWIATPWSIDDATHALMRANGWCFLVQRVNADLTALEQEVIGAGADYPIVQPVAAVVGV